MTLDFDIFQFFHSLVGKYWLLDGLAVFFAEYFGYVLLTLFIFLIFWRYRRWPQRFYLIFLSSLSLLAARGFFVEAIRFFYVRSRPFQLLNFDSLISPPVSSAMPSGHATVFFALAMLMFYIDKRYFWYFFTGALLMGIGRVMVGVHWPMDIVVGAVIGMASVVVARKILPRITA